MFALVVAGVLLVRRSPWAAAVPIVAGGVLKLFPAAAVAVFARSRRRLAAGAAAVAVLLAYGLASLSDIRTLRSVIPREVVASYGAGVPVQALHDAGVSWAQSPAEVRYLRVGLLALGIVLAAVLLRSARHPGSEPDDRRLDAFWAGAAIYAATYVFGSNFDYRLAFLVLCVPQLCAWTRPGAAPLPGARAALGALVVTMWLSSAQPPLPFGLQTWYEGLSFPPEEVLNWLLFAWLVGAIAATAPVELRRRLARRAAR
jgi:hypothetical protein